jgi:NAD(P)-dependent dehydrogenase (short-subunit alcohol dehydrogenase family)
VAPKDSEVQTMTGIEGKTVIVTGGASGIGKAAALAFGLAGARVLVATARSVGAAEQTVKDIRWTGGVDPVRRL